MKFKSFYAENFITFPVIELEFDSSDRGLTLVDGWNHDQGQANGAGKSVLFNSIAFAVYGKTATDVNLADLVPEWGGTLKTVVMVETAAGMLIIERTRKPNAVKLFVNNVEFKGTAESVEKRILELVGLTFEQFLQVAYFYQGARDRFVDVNDTAKKSFLASVLGLDKCEIAYTKAHEKLKTAESAKATLDGKVSTLKSVLQGQQAAHENALRTLDAFIEARPAKEAEIRGRYASDDKETQLQKRLEAAEAAKKVAEGEAEEALKIVLPDRAKLVEQQELGIKAGQMVARLRAEIESSERELRTLRRDQEKLGGTSAAPANCYACGQALPQDPSAHERIHKEIEAKKAEIETVTAKIVENQGKLAKAETLARKCDGARQQITDLNAQIAVIQNKSFQVQLKIQEVNAAKAALAGVEQLKAQREQAMKNELASLNDREESLIDQSSAAGAMAATTQNKLDEASTQLNKAKDEIAYLQETKRIFSPIGLRAHVVDGVVSELNERIEHYLSELFSGQMRFHYDLDESGKLIGKLFFAGRERSSLATLSGGQRQRVRLAVDLALSDVVANRLAVKTNVMFLDEVTDGMDSIGREGLMAILSELERSRDAIFVADHESEFKSRFSRSIWLELKKGQTSMSRGV